MFHLLMVLVILGVVLYLVENFIPMSEPVKIVFRVVVVVILIVLLLDFAGVVDVPTSRMRR